MDTNRIKRFATEARNILKAGIAAKILTLGFDKNGHVAEENLPQLMQGGSVWNGQLQTEGFYHQWMALYHRIKQIGIKDVYEEAAYTWFNRLCAIRILQKNNLCSPVLAYADAARTPIIVDEARQGSIPQMKEEMRQRLMELLDDDTKVTEQFAILITAWCHDNPIINQCFGSMADYTELLLPNNILAEGGFVDLLNHTEFITDEDFKSPELIGWLYQFYISERKDEVFAKKGKFEADEIPAATQIFTPNWIVKYMVQNTVGRIYLDNNPYENQLQKKWQYLVEPTEKPSEDTILKYNELTDLKVADLACGSGHILNECFDLLYDLYIAEGYGRGEAIENIFTNNLTGIDLDTRAKQLATFALLLKACQKDSSFADAHCMPNVLNMPKAWDEEKYGKIDDFLDYFFQEQLTKQGKEEIKEAFELIKDADSLGSIMKFNLSDTTRLAIKYALDYWSWETLRREPTTEYIPAFKLMYALTEKYHALVMNPPYMGSGNMNGILSKYVKDNYTDQKQDLMTVFMKVADDQTLDKGLWAMINLPSWMFLGSFEKMRKDIVSKKQIVGLLQNGRGIFGADFGSVTFVIKKTMPYTKGQYRKLYDNQDQAIVRTSDTIHSLFLDPTYGYYQTDQSNFKKIPGCPIGFWITEEFSNKFRDYPKLKSEVDARVGMVSGDNNRFLRFWHEVSSLNIEHNAKPFADPNLRKWYPIQKGGDFRLWYGNLNYVVNWENNGYEIMHDNFKGTRVRSHNYNGGQQFKEGITWNSITMSKFQCRYSPEGFTFDAAGPLCEVTQKEHLHYILGFLSGKVARFIFSILNPTVNFPPGYLESLPLIYTSSEQINKLVQTNVSLSKLDWDAHETSWDFLRNELLSIDEQTYKANLRYEKEKQSEKNDEQLNITDEVSQYDSLEWRMEQYKQKWEHNFMQLHANEEELNRQFIDIYGLQDELSPEVPLNEITILQQGEMKITDQYGLSDEDGSVFTDDDGAILTVTGDSYIDWQDDGIMKQFISYAVGCMLGRYRLDKPGLHIAHPNPTDEEIAPYEYKGETWEIDDDGIMPLMANDCSFSDNASVRFADFIRVALGNEKHVENLNYVEQCLGKTLEQYFIKDFWKDHKKMYQNRPIYWLFSSKKGAFQVIAYMHRMNAYTVERIRAKYLLPYIEHLEAEIGKLDARRAELSTKESKHLQALQKQLDECREYHERLQVVAEQAISFDLDDGVVVNYARFGDILQKIK